MSYEASTSRTWSGVVLLGVLLGLVSCYGAPAERRWETLFSRSVPGVPRGEASWERDYLLGIKRVRRLYCNVGIGYHLQVLPGGRVSGVHSESQYSLLEISTVERGVVSLYGVRSALFVAMDSRGRLYGTAVFQDECRFRESLLPNNYNAYESAVHRGCYVALGRHGRVRRGGRASTATTATHFLPRI